MIKKGLLILFLFNYIYTPTIFDTSMLNVLAIISLVYLIYNRKKTIEIIKIIRIKKYIIYLFLIILYLIVSAIVNNSGYVDIYRILLLAVQTTICSLFIISMAQELKIDEKEFYKIIIIVGVIQAIIGVACYFCRDLQNLVIELSIMRGVKREIANIYREYRYFGFSSELTFSMPISQIMILLLMWIKYKPEKFYQYLFEVIVSMILIFSAVINARISIIILLIAIIVIIIYKLINVWKKSRKNFVKIIIIYVIGIVVLNFICVFFGEKITNKNQTAKWIKDGMDEIVNVILFRNNTNSTYSALTENIKLPESFKLFFGTGKNIFSNQEYRTDMGYINDIWVGGIIYCLLIYGTVIYFYFPRKQDNIQNIIIKIVFIITLLITNIKGQIFNSNCLMSLGVLLIVELNYIIYKNNKKNVGVM